MCIKLFYVFPDFKKKKKKKQYPWESWKEPEFTAKPEMWHHDIFWSNGTSFDQRETDLIKELMAKSTEWANRV